MTSRRRDALTGSECQADFQLDESRPVLCGHIMQLSRTTPLIGGLSETNVGVGRTDCANNGVIPYDVAAAE